jgi:cyclohexadienyl dehydratase
MSFSLVPLKSLGFATAALLACAGASAQTVVSVLPASSLDAVQKAGVLRICTPGDYKPFSFQKPDGTFEGIDVDLM